MIETEAMNTSKGDKFGFRTAPETLAQLDELRKAEADLPSRGEMLRRLVKRAVEAKAAQAKAKKKGGD
jgi:hypothetical protein